MDTHIALRPPEPVGAGPRRATPGLPTDIVRQSVVRLRALALLYAITFFLAGIFPAFFTPADRALFLSSPAQWLPSTLSIVVALGLWVLLRSGRVPLSATLSLGLGFEVVSSYGIATAELMGAPALPDDPNALALHGLSWVAVWVLLFTIVLPARPGRVLLAALASVAAVPVTLVTLEALGLSQLRLGPLPFFFGEVFPYLLVVGMAYAGARVVYALGTEVRRAREVGSYQLEEKLGQGGMGEVWRARHRLLARPAAIKVMRAPLQHTGTGEHSAANLLRFEREAQVIANLRSPHTVDLYDFGVTEDGAFYYAMEILDGLDADHFVRRFGPLSAARTVYLLRQMCHSISEAESLGVVHRDIKPANIFLCRYGKDCDFVKVLDFGIAKLNHDLPAPGLTGENVVQGTPAFMAPEQALGQPVDTRTDIYALGCVGYWLLTGHLVFDAPSPMALLMQHTSSAPVAPSTRCELPIPPDLDQLMLDCLAKDPARRPASADELGRRLEAIRLDEPWNQAQARAWWIKAGLP